MNTTETGDVARTITGFLDLNERRLGTIKEATALLHELLKASRETGKGGSVSITFKVEPDKTDELAFTIDQEVTSKIPKPARKKAMVYHDAENRAFTKTDPRQLELLAEQAAEKAEREEQLREAGIAKIGRGAEVATA